MTDPEGRVPMCTVKGFLRGTNLDEEKDTRFSHCLSVLLTIDHVIHDGAEASLACELELIPCGSLLIAKQVGKLTLSRVG